jgi:CRISPR system Cascade subunit CasA
MKWNLLSEDLLRVETKSGIENMSIPKLLEALGRDEVESYPGIQRHQEEAFHVFLCYLAGAVLARKRTDQIIQEKDFWSAGIREISGDDPDAAWSLIVDDPMRPAFMQSSVPSRKIFEKYKPGARTPDDLDVLQTAKNHDVKMTRISDPDPEDWIYALISLQTMCGFLGQGNYGIARMNGGFGNRVVVELLASNRYGRRWLDAVTRLLEYRARLLQDPWHYKDSGTILIWTTPWDLKTSLPLADLDPFFIESARAVRLVEDNDEIIVLAAATKAPRLAAKDQKGNLGDPWSPLDKKKDSALTLSASGFTAELLRNLIFQEGYELLRMQKPMDNWKGKRLELACSVLVRGQGTTDGFHSVSVYMPARAHATIFGGGIRRERLSGLSKQAIDHAGAMQNKVLKPALYCFLESAPEKLNFDKREISSWWQSCRSHFNKRWGQEYFPWLWRANEESDDGAAIAMWIEMLGDIAWQVFQESMNRYPAKHSCQYKARANAISLFWGLIHKHFKASKEVLS